MLFSTNTDNLFSKLGAERALNMIIDAGFPAVDISYYKPSDDVLSEDYAQTARKIRHTAESRGAVINQIHTPFAGFDSYVGEIIPTMSRYIELAGLLGAEVAVVHPIQNGSYYRDREMLREMNMKFYSSLAPVAKACGVKIGIENMWKRRPVSNFIDDSVCADPLELASYYDELADPEAFTVCLDIGHVALCGREPEYAIETLGGRIGALHVHDVDYVSDLHTLPGQGKIEWDKVIAALAKINYNGCFTLEANNFWTRYDECLLPDALRFMSRVAKHLSDKLEGYKLTL